MKKESAKPARQNRAPQVVKLPRQISYTSQRCLRLAQLGWEWALASLPLDLILVLSFADHSAELSPDATAMIILLLVVAAVGTLREQMFSLVGNLRRFQMKIEHRHIKIALILLGVVGAAEIAARLLAHPIGAPFAFIGIAGVAVLASLARSFKQLKKQGEKFLSDRLAQVEQANTLHLTAIGVPLAAARLIGLCVAVQTWDLTTTVMGTVTSLILILALHPTQRDFFAPCPRCQRMTSRVLKAEGYCPACRPEKFQGS